MRHRRKAASWISAVVPEFTAQFLEGIGGEEERRAVAFSQAGIARPEGDRPTDRIARLPALRRMVLTGTCRLSSIDSFAPVVSGRERRARICG